MCRTKTASVVGGAQPRGTQDPKSSESLTFYHLLKSCPDELKEKEGLVGKLLRRIREDVDSIQAISGSSTKAITLASGDSIQLL